MTKARLFLNSALIYQVMRNMAKSVRARQNFQRLLSASGERNIRIQEILFKISKTKCKNGLIKNTSSWWKHDFRIIERIALTCRMLFPFRPAA